MREKIARAMYGAHPRNKPYDLLRPEFKAQYLKQADAVLNALMEPTEWMFDDLGGTALQWAPGVWQAMIRAAKEGK